MGKCIYSLDTFYKLIQPLAVSLLRKCMASIKKGKVYDEKDDKITLNNFVLRLTIFTMTTLLLRIKLKVNFNFLFRSHFQPPVINITCLSLISEMKRSK